MNLSTQVASYGDRFPFNDEELAILLRCHRYILSPASFTEGGEEPFLLKLARGSIGDSVSALAKEEKLAKVRTVVQAILPTGFFGVLSVENKDFMHPENFLQCMSEYGRRGAKVSLDKLFSFCSDDDGLADPRELIDLCHRLVVAKNFLSDDTLCGNDVIPVLKPPLSMVESLQDALVINEGQYLSSDTKNVKVDAETFHVWSDINAPSIHATLLTFMQELVFPDLPFPKYLSPIIMPNLCGQGSGVFVDKHSTLLFSFACMSPHLGGKWYRLYSSDYDGKCFNRLQTRILGYDGPTIVLIKPTNNDDSLFGAFNAHGWKESNKFYGTSDCFLYQAMPRMRMYYPLGSGSENFMYFNSKTRTRTYDGLAHGFGFGGDSKKPRLFISDFLENCFAGGTCSTFDDGPLVEGWNENFDVDVVEVWGVGSEYKVSSALAARTDYWKYQESHVLRAKQVDKLQLLRDFESGVADSHLYFHRGSMRGRHNFHADSQHGGYRLERDDSGDNHQT